MRRIRRLLMIALGVVMMFGMTVHAEGNTEFHVENQTGKAGDIVTVPVQFNSGQEVGGFQISIYYDSEMMEFQSLEKGDLIIEEGQGIFDYNHIPESSEIIVVYAVLDTVKDEGVIVNLKFKLKQDCGEQLPIGMGVDEVVDNTEESAPLTGEVSGVDEAFQAQVMEQTGGNTAVAADSGSAGADGGSRGEASDTEKTADEGKAADGAEDSAESGTGEGDADEDRDRPEIREADQDTGEKETEEESGNGAKILLIAVIAAGAAAVAGASVYMIRRKKR